MVIIMNINIGDLLTLKKPHPCGRNEWLVLRIGADFRLKCQGCGHQLMLSRLQLEKSITKSKLENPKENRTTT